MGKRLTKEQFGRQCDALLDPPDEDEPPTDAERESNWLHEQDQAQDRHNEHLSVLLGDEMYLPGVRHVRLGVGR